MSFFYTLDRVLYVSFATGTALIAVAFKLTKLTEFFINIIYYFHYFLQSTLNMLNYIPACT